MATFTVNGKEIAGAYDEMMKINKLFIPTADITDGTVIEIID